jgi:hypothetical protein
VIDPEQRHTRSELLRRAAGLGIGLAGLAWLPGRALAAPAGTSLVSRDEPLDGARGGLGATRTLAPRSAPRFTLIGLHWQGAGSVFFRTRTVAGRWSEWQRAVVHELPDPGGEGARTAGWHVGTPVWAGLSDAVELRVEGRVGRLRAHYVLSEPRAVRHPASASQPFIVRRASWGADEAIVRGDPSYAARLIGAFVHHTAGSTPTSPEESAAVARAIQVYHVKSNGWKDIGYNFLVDPFGQVLEGRAGGLERNVVGAHALGFNTGSVGISLLGNFEKKTLTPEAEAALAALLAWRLDVGHVDPLSSVRFVSDGRVHSLRAVSGHRDVNATACPGANLYPELDTIAGEAALVGLPKLYEPVAQRTSKGTVIFRARLSEPLPWRVTVRDSKGAQVAAGSGTGSLVEWTWQAAPNAPSGTYRYAIEAGTDVRPATGRLSLGVAEEPEPPPPPPARPPGVPRRIPAWAWELRLWHLTPKAERGPRPASAPRRLPSWYWPWFNWQQAFERWKDQYG